MDFAMGTYRWCVIHCCKMLKIMTAAISRGRSLNKAPAHRNFASRNCATVKTLVNSGKQKLWPIENFVKVSRSYKHQKFVRLTNTIVNSGKLKLQPIKHFVKVLRSSKYQEIVWLTNTPVNSGKRKFWPIEHFRKGAAVLQVSENRETDKYIIFKVNSGKNRQSKWPHLMAFSMASLQAPATPVSVEYSTRLSSLHVIYKQRKPCRNLHHWICEYDGMK